MRCAARVWPLPGGAWGLAARLWGRDMGEAVQGCLPRPWHAQSPRCTFKMQEATPCRRPSEPEFVKRSH